MAKPWWDKDNWELGLFAEPMAAAATHGPTIQAPGFLIELLQYGHFSRL